MLSRMATERCAGAACLPPRRGRRPRAGARAAATGDSPRGIVGEAPGTGGGAPPSLCCASLCTASGGGRRASSVLPSGPARKQGSIKGQYDSALKRNQLSSSGSLQAAGTCPSVA